MLRRSSLLLLSLASLTLAQQIGSVGDWPDWRGPDRDGTSREKGLPEKWSLDGQNLAWKGQSFAAAIWSKMKDAMEEDRSSKFEWNDGDVQIITLPPKDKAKEKAKELEEFNAALEEFMESDD